MTDFTMALRKQTLIVAMSYFATGLLFVCFPGITAKAIALIVSVALLALGLIKIAIFFARRSTDFPDISSLPTGIMLALAALVFIIKPDLLASIIYAILGIGVLVNGAFKLQVGVELKRDDSPFWGSAVVAAAATIVLGAIAVFAPFEEAQTVTMLVGISMICCAVFDAVCAIFFLKTNN